MALFEGHMKAGPPGLAGATVYVELHFKFKPDFVLGRVTEPRIATRAGLDSETAMLQP